MGKKLNILFVDDDISILNSIRRAVRSMRQEWECEFANSGEKGLKILTQKKFDLVVSDMRMPGMDGAEFLNQVKNLYPDTLRFILSGQTEGKAFVRAFGSMHQFLSKPCGFDFLKKSINSSLSLNDHLQDKKLKETLLNIDSLPSLPELYYDLMEELKSENSTLETIGNIISKDVSMSANILKVANSAFFGISQKVSTPVGAVQVLGLDFIQSLVLQHQVFSKQNVSKSIEPIVKKIYANSLQVGYLCLSLAKTEKMDNNIQNFSFTAGLFHEIGKFICLLNFPEKFKKVSWETNCANESIMETEIEAFGAPHTQIGAYILRLWGLPYPIVEAVAFQNFPSKSSNKFPTPLTFVHLANSLILNSTKLDEPYLREIGIFDHLNSSQKNCNSLSLNPENVK